MSGTTAVTKSLRSSMLPGREIERPAGRRSPAAGMGVMAAVTNMMSSSRFGHDSMLSGPEGCQHNATLQCQAERAYAQQWTLDEQKSLESGLSRWPAERHPPLEQYSRIATLLPRKGIRDVALRIQWMARFTKRKQAHSMAFLSAEDVGRPAKRLNSQSIFSAVPMPLDSGMGSAGVMHMGPNSLLPGPQMAMGPMGAVPMQPVASCTAAASLSAPIPAPAMPLDDHGSSGVGSIGGPIDALLDQNYAILNEFKANMAVYKVAENTTLLIRYRDNILAVLHHMQSMGGVMAEMPPLPVRLNAELAANFLPTSGLAHPAPMGMQVMQMLPPHAMYDDAAAGSIPAASGQFLPVSIPGGQSTCATTHAAAESALGLKGSTASPDDIPQLHRDSCDMLLSHPPSEGGDDILVDPSVSAAEAVPLMHDQQSSANAVDAASEQQRVSLHATSRAHQNPPSQAGKLQQAQGQQQQHLLPSIEHRRASAGASVPIASAAASPVPSRAFPVSMANPTVQTGAQIGVPPSATLSKSMSTSGICPGGSTADRGSAGRALPRMARPSGTTNISRSCGVVPGGTPSEQQSATLTAPQARATVPPGLCQALLPPAGAALGVSAPVMLPQARERTKSLGGESQAARQANQPKSCQQNYTQPLPQAKSSKPIPNGTAAAAPPGAQTPAFAEHANSSSAGVQSNGQRIRSTLRRGSALPTDDLGAAIKPV